MTDRPFYVLIQDEVARRKKQSDNDLLRDLQSLPPLLDEYIWFGMISRDNPIWDDSETEQQLVTFLAMTDLVADRKLRAGVSLLLEKASYGDMGETMRGLRHSLEKAYTPDWSTLADVCMKAAQHQRPGTRLWAIDELGVLRDHRALPILFDAIYDRAHLVRKQAIHSIGMVLRAQDKLPPQVKQQLERIVIDHQRTQDKFRRLMDEIRDIPESSE